jgi:uncharacterized protein involved in tellurium resistance
MKRKGFYLNHLFGTLDESEEEKATIVVKEEGLRKRMGAAARWQVEGGDCSVERRKAKLKEVFDQATS